jgi:hypothetical protein
MNIATAIVRATTEATTPAIMRTYSNPSCRLPELGKANIVVAGRFEDRRMSEDMTVPLEVILVGTTHVVGGGVDRLNDPPKLGEDVKDGVEDVALGKEVGVLVDVSGGTERVEVDEANRVADAESQEVPKSVCVGTVRTTVIKTVLSMGTGTVTTRPTTRDHPILILRQWTQAPKAYPE